MRPIEFPEQTTVLGQDQPEYQPLPVYRDSEGLTISCWQLSWKEILILLMTRRLWLRQLTFNHPLQPQLPDVVNPWRE